MYIRAILCRRKNHSASVGGGGMAAVGRGQLTDRNNITVWTNCGSVGLGLAALWNNSLAVS